MTKVGSGEKLVRSGLEINPLSGGTYVCVYVCERERGGERERAIERERERERGRGGRMSE